MPQGCAIRHSAASSSSKEPSRPTAQAMFAITKAQRLAVVVARSEFDLCEEPAGLALSRATATISIDDAASQLQDRFNLQLQENYPDCL